MNFKTLCFIGLFVIAITGPLILLPCQTNDAPNAPITVLTGEKFTIETLPTCRLPIVWYCKTDALPDNVRLTNIEFPTKPYSGTIYTFEALKEGTINLESEGYFFGIGIAFQKLFHHIIIKPYSTV